MERTGGENCFSLFNKKGVMKVAVTIQTMISDIMFHNCLNQQELAKKLGVDSSCISRWLNGKSEPRLSEFRRLQEEYDKIPKDVPAV